MLTLKMFLEPVRDKDNSTTDSVAKDSSVKFTDMDADEEVASEQGGDGAGELGRDGSLALANGLMIER